MAKDGCGDGYCKEHFGMKLMLGTICLGVVANLALQGFNSFVQVAGIRESITELKGELKLLKEKDAEAMRRIALLEARQ